MLVRFQKPSQLHWFIMFLNTLVVNGERRVYILAGGEIVGLLNTLGKNEDQRHCLLSESIGIVTSLALQFVRLYDSVKTLVQRKMVVSAEINQGLKIYEWEELNERPSVNSVSGTPDRD